METLTIKKEQKIAVLAWLVYVITMIAVIVAKVVFHDLYIGCCIIIGIGMLVYIAVLSMIKGDYEELKNRAILTYSGITKFIFLFGVTFENKLFVPEALYSHDSFLTYLAYIIAPIFVVVELFLYIKDKKSAKLRTYVMVTFLIIYYMGLMNISSHWVIMIIVPILTAFTGFQNVKTVILGGSIVSVLALLGAMRHIHFWETGVVGDMVWGIPRALKYFLTVRSTEETGYLRWSYIIFVLFVSFFTVVTMLVTRHIKNYNDDKLEVIKKEQENTQKLVEKILDIGMEVKKSAFDTNNIVNELDKTIEKSGAVLEEVEKSNSKKQKGITQQDEMNENIAILIKDLVREVDKASNATKDTLTGLENSRISFEDLKNKSDKIYGNNKEVIEVIEQFVKTAKEVRNITSGIAGISDETNLLALNASIKSARAGEVGKGFAVVAKQVRQLAVETSELTEEIDSMVEKLQASAFISQDAMDEVVGAINEENQTIDQTIKDFENMQTNIHGLSENVIGIDSSVNELARFNEEIENHINELADLSKKVSLDIKGAENSNNDNKERILLTRQLMDEMLVVAERMDEFYYQNGGQYE